MKRSSAVIFITLIVLIVIIVRISYDWFIRSYLRDKKTGEIDYDWLLKHGIQVVSKDNYFMNYGLWDSTHTTLQSANENLVSYIFEKLKLKLNTNERQNLKILDVGCGYGVQDVVWGSQLDTFSHITAIDISPTQIDHARTQFAHIQNVEFKVGDACKLYEQFKQEQFDAVISLESAFHYDQRPLFFQNVNSVLKENGRFVIADIVLQNSYKPSFFSNRFLNIYSDILNIPPVNLITADQWKQDLENAELEIIEYNDITEQVFVPYYTHFFETYCKNKGIVNYMWPFKTLFESIQPFSYIVAVCEKKYEFK